MLKSRLQKLYGLTHIKLKENITKVISEIHKEKYKIIFKYAYESPENMFQKIKQEKLINIIKIILLYLINKVYNLHLTIDSGAGSTR